jgi:EAL domain-containing protein (putative c-di-GMP-specific phosphodiesterase class I)
VFGYEVLSRGKPPLESPEAFFRVARENDMLWECEQACRKAAFRAVRLGRGARTRVSSSTSVPRSLSTPASGARFRPRVSRKRGFSEQQLVFEITAKCSVPDYRALSEAVAISGSRGSRSRWTIWAPAIRGFRRWPAAPRTT